MPLAPSGSSESRKQVPCESELHPSGRKLTLARCWCHQQARPGPLQGHSVLEEYGKGKHILIWWNDQVLQPPPPCESWSDFQWSQTHQHKTAAVAAHWCRELSVLEGMKHFQPKTPKEVGRMEVAHLPVLGLHEWSYSEQLVYFSVVIAPSKMQPKKLYFGGLVQTFIGTKWAIIVTK